MRKFLLHAIVLLMSSTVAMASAPAMTETATVQTAQQKIAGNQKYVFVPGADDPVSGWGLPKNAGAVTCMGSVIPSQYLEAYAGAKVIGMRFLTQSEQTVTPRLYTVDGETVEVASAAETGTSASPLNDEHTAFDEHWNEVTFDKPYTIPSSPVSLMAAFDYTQVETKDAAGYPFLIGKTSDKTAVIRAYGDFGDGAQWKDVRTGNTMCVQLLVEKENGSFADDISVVSIIADPMVKVEDWVLFPFQFVVRNASDGECDDCQFAILFDGEEVGYIETVPGYGIGKQGVIYSTGFYPSRHKHADGVHSLGIKVKKVNGNVPEGNTEDDVLEVPLRIYTETTARQNSLVEHFTTWSDPACTVGYDAMRNLLKKRSDVAWVSIHGTADQKNPDPMAVDGASYIFNYSATGYPAFNVNRYRLDNTQTAMTTVGGSARLTADSIASAIDTYGEKVPALVKLGMKTSLNVADDSDTPSARLTVTVTGEGVENASKILDTAVLGLYVTENGATGRQNTTGGWTDGYSHDCVLRAIATDSPWGDPVVWDGDRFEKTYDVELPAGQLSRSEYANLNAVAFVSLPYVLDAGGSPTWNIDTANAWVNQCLALNIKDSGTSGIGMLPTANATVVARYAADGTRISAPQKGLNILKMSDGTTRKVVVSK